jgi:hypothetical protein
VAGGVGVVLWHRSGGHRADGGDLERSVAAPVIRMQNHMMSSGRVCVRTRAGVGQRGSRSVAPVRLRCLWPTGRVSFFYLRVFHINSIVIYYC